MRKRLVALLSLAGFANSATPATPQVVKGSNPPADTKSESQVKIDKAQQENAAAQNDASKKLRKAGGEQQAAQDVVSEKIGPDHISHKHIGGVKYEKKTTENNAGKTQATSKDSAKLTKANSENVASKSTIADKRGKTVTQDALTVKQKTGTEDAATIKLRKKTVEKGASNQIQKPTPEPPK